MTNVVGHTDLAPPAKKPKYVSPHRVLIGDLERNFTVLDIENVDSIGRQTEWLYAFKYTRELYGVPVSPVHYGYAPVFTYAKGNALRVDDAERNWRTECGRGVNVATLDWVLCDTSSCSFRRRKGIKDRYPVLNFAQLRAFGIKVWLIKFHVMDIAAVPRQTDGKIRLSYGTIVGELVSERDAVAKRLGIPTMEFTPIGKRPAPKAYRTWNMPVKAGGVTLPDGRTASSSGSGPARIPSAPTPMQVLKRDIAALTIGLSVKSGGVTLPDGHTASDSVQKVYDQLLKPQPIAGKKPGQRKTVKVRSKK
jgi:hypothetical protein